MGQDNYLKNFKEFLCKIYSLEHFEKLTLDNFSVPSMIIGPFRYSVFSWLNFVIYIFSVDCSFHPDVRMIKELYIVFSYDFKSCMQNGILFLILILCVFISLVFS